jgi:hypothetical protein
MRELFEFRVNERLANALFHRPDACTSAARARVLGPRVIRATQRLNLGV